MPEPKRNRQEDTDDHGVELWVVYRPGSELPTRSNETPDRRSSEEYLIMGTCQLALLIRVTDVLNVGKYPCLHADLNERGETGSDQLYQERGSGWYFDIMAQFQILDERRSLSQSLD